MFTNRFIVQRVPQLASNGRLRSEGGKLNPIARRPASSLRVALARQLTTTSQVDASPEPGPSSSSTGRSYPFSGAVTSSPKPIPYDQKLGLMGNVEKKLISGCVNQEFHNLFRKNHPESVRPLSVIKVESYTNVARTTSNVFTGILMAVRRRGTETSFRLRTILERVGVEMKFNVFSPVIKSITVIKRAGDLTGAINGKPVIRKPRRAKLYYLRDHPQKMPDIRKISKAVLAAQNREEADR
ncbi:hypothetical protein MJO28_013470 [Puccinia striiformis f. sp. tritici]|uniref:Ribosomal protein L19 n=4 Tax=Puccinia striiformis TaxID=27350 RepID=A0A0L0VXT6_9BASI|nr:hypothetical protein Pst134EA_024093 [Puccinia striiformis f. sp. tritici]KAI9606538.1 hypothetical protein H4Q26_006072 [Puccinia striiformis f. sp. tritici PST-130]KNF04114.1 hypothetical protein PSTG_02819 [Puccinia striiformis f. sp. tritici PST-78]POW10336.1 hypothetical protein PSTT_06150 [Puccinia striiformis]KAH9444492.1 hypothetical protein Pst134EB_024754 [Puccinia striiformis f. sp. tritici]KAH9444504.1 hypothetical protein Pst134EB_024766 [Puccinia striiformis f. sp. tritici]